MVKYYDEDVISCLSPSIVLSPFFEEWFLYVEDILINDEFQKRKLFMHHHNISVWEHSILVSFKSFVVAKYFNADARICAIAGLLHDFYTKAWIKTQDVLELDNLDPLVLYRYGLYVNSIAADSKGIDRKVITKS